MEFYSNLNVPRFVLAHIIINNRLSTKCVGLLFSMQESTVNSLTGLARLITGKPIEMFTKEIEGVAVRRDLGKRASLAEEALAQSYVTPSKKTNIGSVGRSISEKTVIPIWSLVENITVVYVLRKYTARTSEALGQDRCILLKQIKRTSKGCI